MIRAANIKTVSSKIWKCEAKILIPNNTANIAKNIVFVRTFRPSTGAIVKDKYLHR